MTRTRLPNRRPQVTDRLMWPPESQRAIDVSVGFGPDGRAMEIFARLERPGSDLDALLDDSAVLLSRCLQHGDKLTDVARGLRRSNGVPATVLGAIVEAATTIERDEAGS
jgi:hypothetical protein